MSNKFNEKIKSQRVYGIYRDDKLYCIWLTLNEARRAQDSLSLGGNSKHKWDIRKGEFHEQ